MLDLLGHLWVPLTLFVYPLLIPVHEVCAGLMYSRLESVGLSLQWWAEGTCWRRVEVVARGVSHVRRHNDVVLAWLIHQIQGLLELLIISSMIILLIIVRLSRSWIPLLFKLQVKLILIEVATLVVVTIIWLMRVCAHLSEVVHWLIAVGLVTHGFLWCLILLLHLFIKLSGSFHNSLHVYLLLPSSSHGKVNMLILCLIIACHREASSSSSSSFMSIIDHYLCQARVFFKESVLLLLMELMLLLQGGKVSLLKNL